MDTYDTSNITDIKEDVVKKWTVRQRIKALKYRTLYKILECEMSVLSAKFPFLDGNQIKCIALNWIGIPTIMDHIPNAETIGYLRPAQDQKKVMTLINLLLSKRRANKKQEKFLNEVSQMILNSFVSLNSLKSNSRNMKLGAEPNESAASSSSTEQSQVNDGHEEQINSLPEEHSSLDAEETIIFQKSKNNMSDGHEEQINPLPEEDSLDAEESIIFQKSKNNMNDGHGEQINPLPEEHSSLDAEETIIFQKSKNNMSDGHEEQINPLPEEHSLDAEESIIFQKSKNPKRRLFWAPGCALSEKRRKRAKNRNLTDFDLSKDSLLMLSDDEMLEAVTKTVISADSILMEDSPYSENMIENTPGTPLSPTVYRTKNMLPEELSKQNTQNRVWGTLVPCSDSDVTSQNLVSNSAPSLVQGTSKQITNERNAAENLLIQVNKPSTKVTANIINETPSDGSYYAALRDHDNATNVEMMENNETAATEMENEEHITAVSGNYTDLVTETQEMVTSQTTTNNVSNSDKGPKRPSKRRHRKISITPMLKLQRVSCLDMASPTISTTPSSKALSLQQSPIQYLSLEPYSSEEESEDKESPSKREEPAQEIQDNQEPLLDLFSSHSSESIPSLRTLMPAEVLGDADDDDDAAVLSLDYF